MVNVALTATAIAGLVVGGFVFGYTGNGIAGLAALLSIAAVGLALLRLQ